MLARQQPHGNIPVGAGQTPPPIVCPDGATPVKNQREEKRAKAQSVGVGGEVGAQKSFFLKRGKKKKEIGGEGRHVKRKRRKVRQYEAEM